MKMKTLQGFYKYKSPANIHIINSNYYNSISNHKSDNRYNNLYSINNYNNVRNNEIKTDNNNNDKYFLKSQNFFAKDFKRFNIPKATSQESPQNKVKNQNKLNYNFYLSSHKFYSHENHTEKYLKNNMATLPTIRPNYTTRYSQNPHKTINFYDDIIKNYKNNIINKNIQITQITNLNVDTNNQYPYKSSSQTKNNNRYFQSIENSTNNNTHSPPARINVFKTKTNNFLSKLDESTKSLAYFSKLSYPLYKNAKQSEKSFDIITSYAANTYKGTVRNYNEDRISVIVNVKQNNYQNLKKKENIKLSFFAIYDGHAGNKCCEYLKHNLHLLIFESNFFPEEPIKAIQQAFDKCEKNFFQTHQSKNKNAKNKMTTIYDQSGSCAIIVIIINDNCYIVNLGDSRALYSCNSGNNFYQLSRDHKPNDNIERNRIYKAGGSIYKTNLASYGFGLGISESSLGFQIPYRILPGRLAVARAFGDISSKLVELNGNPNVLINMPSITSLKIDDKSDFILIGCDGIFDRLDNIDILKTIWGFKKKGNKFKNIHSLSANIVDSVIKFSLVKLSGDNVTCIFIAFKNFKEKMEDESFEYEENKNIECKYIGDEIDLGDKN